MTRLFDYRLMQLARDQIAHDYLNVAAFQARLEEDLLERLELLNIPIKTIVLWGAGNHQVIMSLLEKFTDASLILMDFSQVMLDREISALNHEQAERVRLIISDGQSLMLDNSSVDLVFSNLHVSLSDDLSHLLTEFHRVLRLNGCVHFSSLGPDTFKELRNAWRQADPEDPYHVIQPPDMHDVGDALVRVGFCEPVVDRTDFLLSYAQLAHLWQDLRANGVRNYFVNRRAGLTGRDRWQNFSQVIAHNQTDGKIMLTLEAIVAQAWKASDSNQIHRDDGSVGIPLKGLFS